MTATCASTHWPRDLVVLDRGWLSSTNLICLGEQPGIIDTSYVKHAADTVARVSAALGDMPLATIAHTHLHSDHCGGTHALQQHWPRASTWVPAASFAAVRDWDPDGLTFRATGQRCPRFRADHALQPGSMLRVGQRDWQVYAAPGHDALALLLFCEQDRILMAGDALWLDGMGIIFPELDGSGTFDAFAQTLDAIEHLAPDWVVPGHGSAFGAHDGAIARALAQARERVAYFTQNPQRHALYAAKVLVKYQLMDVERMSRAALWQWASSTSDFHRLHALSGTALEPQPWFWKLVAELVAKGALHDAGDAICNV